MAKKNSTLTDTEIRELYFKPVNYMGIPLDLQFVLTELEMILLGVLMRIKEDVSYKRDFHSDSPWFPCSPKDVESYLLSWNVQKIVRTTRSLREKEMIEVRQTGMPPQREVYIAISMIQTIRLKTLRQIEGR